MLLGGTVKGVPSHFPKMCFKKLTFEAVDTKKMVIKFQCSFLLNWALKIVEKTSECALVILLLASASICMKFMKIATFQEFEKFSSLPVHFVRGPCTIYSSEDVLKIILILCTMSCLKSTKVHPNLYTPLASSEYL